MAIRILVVLDEHSIADDIAEILRESGHHALPLYDAADALEHLGQIHFDLALVGVVTPHLAGLRLGERLCDMNNPLGHWIQVIFMATKETVEILKTQRPEFEFLSLPLETKGLLNRVLEIERQRATDLQEVLEFFKESEPCPPDQ